MDSSAWVGVTSGLPPEANPLLSLRLFGFGPAEDIVVPFAENCYRPQAWSSCLTQRCRQSAARNGILPPETGAPKTIALGHQGVVVTSELLQRVAAMPATRRHTAWGFRRRAALANMVIPREQQCYPRSVLPAEKFQQQDGESK